MQRLKLRSQFQAVLAGDRIAGTAHFVLHRCAASQMLGASAGRVLPPDGETACSALQQAWIGAMVPKRWAKRAVTRNTIKRQIYSVSSEIASEFSCAAHLVRLRAGFDKNLYGSADSRALRQLVRQELMQLFAHGLRSAGRLQQNTVARS